MEEVVKVKPTTQNISAISQRIAEGEWTLTQAAKETGWQIVEYDGHDYLLPRPNEWYADDGNAEVAYTASSGYEAAKNYVDDGIWNWEEDDLTTTFIRVHVWQEALDEEGDIVEIFRDTEIVPLDPPEPDCVDGQEHDWQERGLQGHGGGVYITEWCIHCGCERVTDTWAQDGGVQGLESVSYEPRKYEDEVEALKAEEEEEEEEEEE